MDSEAQGAERLWPMAVRADGRRSASASALDADGILWPGTAGDPVVLDHAGPQTACWASERPLGATEVPEPATGRRPRALDDQGWRALAEGYARAADAVRRVGRTAVLGIDDDGLLQATLSPRTGGVDAAARLARVLALHRACGPIDVALCVEELAPQGLDPTDGIQAARALVEQGARTLYVSAGTRAFAPLLTRAKGGSVGDPGLRLRSAAWLVGRVAARLVAIVDEVHDDLTARARALGLSGVCSRGAA